MRATAGQAAARLGADDGWGLGAARGWASDGGGASMSDPATSASATLAAGTSARPLPPLGTRLRLWWPAEQCWFVGRVGEVYESAEAAAGVVHRIDYDDGDVRYYDLARSPHPWEVCGGGDDGEGGVVSAGGQLAVVGRAGDEEAGAAEVGVVGVEAVEDGAADADPTDVDEPCCIPGIAPTRRLRPQQLAAQRLRDRVRAGVRPGWLGTHVLTPCACVLAQVYAVFQARGRPVPPSDVRTALLGMAVAAAAAAA